MMKKTMSRIFTALMIGAMLVVPVSADIMPRGNLCSACETGEIRAYTTYGTWGVVGYDNCIHGDPTHRDTIKEREITTRYECDRCGYLDGETSRTEQRYFH